MKQLLEKNDKEHVVATCRNPSASTGLLNLKDQFSDRLQVLPLDLTDESSIQVLHASFPFVVFSFFLFVIHTHRKSVLNLNFDMGIQVT